MLFNSATADGVRTPNSYSLETIRHHRQQFIPADISRKCVLVESKQTRRYCSQPAYQTTAATDSAIGLSKNRISREVDSIYTVCDSVEASEYYVVVDGGVGLCSLHTKAHHGAYLFVVYTDFI